jgi:hypothetical protein
MESPNIFLFLVAGVYYILAGLLSFFAIFSVYILNRYGQSRSFSLVISLVFAGLFLSVLSRSFSGLQNLF